MSKAFTKEDAHLEDDSPPAHAAFPSGIRNYLTKEGARRLQEELSAAHEERTRRRQEPTSEEAAHRLRRVESRLRELGERLASAQVVEVSREKPQEVQFGVTVVVRDGSEEFRYRIVGVDEADFDRGWVGWQSPLARALLGRRIGERVTLLTPAGERSLEVLRLSVEE